MDLYCRLFVGYLSVPNDPIEAPSRGWRRSRARPRYWYLAITLPIVLLAVAILSASWHFRKTPAVHEMQQIPPKTITVPPKVQHPYTLAGVDPAATRPNAILWSGQPSISSPNGAYKLTLRPNGDLVLVGQNFHSGDTGRPLWWTSTGDNRSRDGHSVRVIPTPDSRHQLVVEALLDGVWSTVWHSDLEPACRASHAEAWNEEVGSGLLQLWNSGRLHLSGTCNLFVPPSAREPQDQSLAVLVAGLYRTNPEACQTQMRNLIARPGPFARVDVFAYVLYEEADLVKHNRTAASIEAAIRECYGSQLRRVQVVSVADEEEVFPGGEDALLEPCGQRLNRLNNQLKTLEMARRLWWGWTVESGMMHDTVLRLRPDTSFQGESSPRFWSLEELGENTLVLPHPVWEHYFYCARSSGRVGVGPTDQIAYGSAAAMGHWLAMYHDFAQIVELASNPTGPAFRDFSGCEDLPDGPRPEECSRPAPCSIECIVAWYLEAKGVRYSVEWEWDQQLLREP